MSIKIEITGGDVTEIAQSLVSLASMVTPNLSDKAACVPSPEEVETVEPPKRPRGRPKKNETIEHDVESEPDARVDDADGEVGEDVEPGKIEPDMTIDDLRKYMLNTYLLKYFSDLDSQKKEFQDMLDTFGIKVIADLPADKIVDFKAMIDARAAKKTEKAK